jgi:response regulator of citrate/malate metabolism
VQAPLLLRQEQIDSSGFFQYQGLAVVAAYNERTRRVSDLLLLGADESELMRRANLELGAADYLVLPVFEAQRPTQLMGLRVLATAPLLP